MSHWALLMSEYDVKLVTPTAIKSQALADLLSICLEKATIEELPDQIPGTIETIHACNEEKTWTLMFDGTSSNPQGGAGVVLIDSHGRNLSFMFRLNFSCTNNEAEYKALMLGLNMAQEVGIKKLHVKRDSNLIIQQIQGGYSAKERGLALCRKQVWCMMKVFDKISFEHVPRTENKHADALATLESRVTIQNGQHALEHRVAESPAREERMSVEEKTNDWRTPIYEQLRTLNITKETRGFCLLNGQMFKKINDGLLMKCVGEEEGKEKTEQLHGATCGEEGPEYLDAGVLPSEKIEAKILKKRSERYFLQKESFTKWVKAIAVREANAEAVVRLIKENIICRFGLPSVLVSDNGTHFVNQRVWCVLKQYEIKHHKSFPYYPQGNGQAEATNKSLLKILTKMVTDAQKDWSEYLPLALWTYRTTRHGTTGVTPFSLVYGVEAVLPAEIEARMLLGEARDREAELQ
ncbi:uncharacterized protein LOC130950053 [Arachis stenosperma]|uniref:uncharacterized protein LOC130950053 n=1 Tax=Arachis stenosperma TaxID=217475 RepID=UPI0025ABD5CE|nr:uncharacterized protein LOC130950053 [Arachis stenosperma]